MRKIPELSRIYDFNNKLVGLIDESELTVAEVVAVLDLASSSLKESIKTMAITGKAEFSTGITTKNVDGQIIMGVITESD